MGGENHHHHHHHHHFYHQNLHIHRHRSTFLPMLCSRPSIKDVILPQWRDRSAPFADDPLSPRIGCMGQVKRHNKIAGFPTSHRLSLTTKSKAATTAAAAAASSTSPVVNYSKLKKLFSSRNLSSTTSTATAPTISSCGNRPPVRVNSADVPRDYNRCRNENFVSISIENMDPPLPVIKRVKKPEEGTQVDSLWKRRSGGAALKSLQLQQFHRPTPRLHLQPTSV